MKTLDEVIKNLEDGTEHLSAMLISKETWGDALSYLNEYKELSKMWNDRLDKENSNPPLTWDELKDMIGKPVWFVYDWNNTHFEGWIIPDHWEGIFIIDAKDNWGLSETNMDKWQAYRKER